MKLSPPLLRAVHRLGFTAPTEVQAETIPKILSGRDVIGSARTGSGKTAAFLLPMIQRLMEQPSRGLRALIISPTRELAVQIERMLYDLARETRVRGYVVYGGVSLQAQRRALLGRLEVLVATPGRLLDHVRRGNVNFDMLDYLVLDEADRMLDMGFLPDVQTIVSILPRRRQTLLFSATIPREVEQLAREIMRDPVRVMVGKQDQPPETIKHVVYPVAEHLKASLLTNLLRQGNWKSVLVFTRTKRRADQLGEQLKDAGLNVGIIHGDRSQSQREAALGRFRSGRHRILVATDVAARGLDISGITHIVNYDVPDSPTNYIHRVGRTARVEASGEAVTLVSPNESRDLKVIEHDLGYSFPREHVSSFDYNARPIQQQRRQYIEHRDGERPPRQFERPRQDRSHGQHGRRFHDSRPPRSREGEGRTDRAERNESQDDQRPPRSFRRFNGPRQGRTFDQSRPRFQGPRPPRSEGEEKESGEHRGYQRKRGKHGSDWRARGSRRARFP